ncbi:hypothetical protein GSI_03208 [Ganoderma sinense ZZ0214-1]|uniref:DNA 3'-5' helicase n=1 Tax=Ganoderma sinense ZZ0214-1 TaxID=1077348 RepID=A0A2G8SL16_9APHY|nr:hypothetical protein GSI_03208 [Ganoderma sinense ZZ0214-1]
MLPRHSQARNAKLSRIKVAEAPKPRPRLSEEDTRKLTALLTEKFKVEPKDFQVAAIKAQIEGVDMIVQAPTGAGKTMLAAGPHIWPGNENKFTIMTCPLLSLEEEMVQTFETEFGLKAIALNSKNGACEPEKINDILALKYQIILISPEMLQSRPFTNRVLRNTPFMRNMISMFIDEAHCVVHWGAEFRKKYGTLGKLRVFFPRGTPVLAVSATLTPRVVRTIHRSLYFSQSEAQSRFVNKGNDRPNVSIVVRACEHPLNSYADLDFLIPEDLNDPQDIPKTYIYVDNIAVGGEIIDYLNAKIRARLGLEDSNLSRKARKRLQGITLQEWVVTYLMSIVSCNGNFRKHFRTGSSVPGVLPEGEGERDLPYFSLSDLLTTSTYSISHNLLHRSHLNPGRRRHTPRKDHEVQQPRRNVIQSLYVNTHSPMA